MLAVVDLKSLPSIQQAEALRLARQRWQHKIMQAVSHAVNCSYFDDDVELASRAVLRSYDKLDFLAGQMAASLVDGLLAVGQTLEPRPAAPDNSSVPGSITTYAGGR